MYLRTAIGRIRLEKLDTTPSEALKTTSNTEDSTEQSKNATVKKEKTFELGEIVKSVNIIVGEQDRASSCSVEIDDPGLKILNEYLGEFQKQGGILVPKGLLSSPQAQKKIPEEGTQSTSAGTATEGFSGQGAKAYKEYLVQTYGSTDLSKLTPLGKRCLKALDNYWVRGFLDAIADAELSPAGARGGKGYGFLFGDKPGGKETFDPRELEKLKDHPRRSRPFSGGRSTATGRYQTLDLVWDDDTPYGRKGLGLTSMHPLQQEILAAGRLKYRRILDRVEAGKYEEAFGDRGRRGFGAMWEWASLNRGGVGAYGRQRTKWGEFSRFTSSAKSYASTAAKEVVKAVGNVQRVVAKPLQAVDDKIQQVESKVELTEEEKEQDSQKTSVLDSSNTPKVVDQDIVDAGIKLHIDVGFNDSKTLRTFTYYLTGIRGSRQSPNTTRLQGKQLRYLMAIAPKKFGTYKNHSLRLLIKLVAERNGLKYILPESDERLDSVIDITQSLENDVQFLNRLLGELGYAVVEDTKSTVTFIVRKLGLEDKRLEIDESYILPGSDWGDIASDQRVLSDAENLLSTEKKLFDLTAKEDSEAGIGKGFEGTLAINTLALPSALSLKPGEIISIKSQSLGKYIAREFRISGVKHSVSGGIIQTSINIYLPVKINRTTSRSAPATQSKSAAAATPQGEYDTSKWADKYKRPAKAGDRIAGFRVSSAFGPRKSPGGIGSRNHGGTDLAASRGTPLHVIGKPDEEIFVTWIPSFGNAGATAQFAYGGYFFECMHCVAGSGRSGKYKGGSKIAEVDNTGSSTGDHLHFQMRKGNRRTGSNRTFNPPAGWIYWTMKGSPPPSA